MIDGQGVKSIAGVNEGEREGEKEDEREGESLLEYTCEEKRERGREEGLKVIENFINVRKVIGQALDVDGNE